MTEPWARLLWHVELTDDMGTVSVLQSRFYYVCAAVELDRLTTMAELRRAMRHKDDVGRFWRALCDDAKGLRFQDAPGEMELAEVGTRLGCEVKFVFGLTRAEKVAQGEKLLEALSG